MSKSQIEKIGKQGITVLLVLLVIEFIIFALLINGQSTKSEVILDQIESYHGTNGYGYNGEIDLGPTFYAISTRLMLGQTIGSTEVSSLQDFVIRQLNSSSGMFMDLSHKNSLHASYYAIGILNQLGSLPSQVNSSLLQESILALQSSNGFFHDYEDKGEFYQVYGDLHSSFQAISILSKLSTNTTEFYLELNRTQFGHALAVLQQTDGSISGDYFSNQHTMNNAYYATSIMDKLNVSLGFFDNLGFSSSALINWIDNQYTEDGFRMTTVSEPSVEASAYALISLKRLAISDSTISDGYGEGINEIVEEIIDEINMEVDPIDAIHDFVLALSITGNLDRLDEVSIPEQLEYTMGGLIAVTSLLLLIAFGISSLRMLREDDQQYFEPALSSVIPKLLEDDEDAWIRINDILGIEVSQAALIDHADLSRGTLRFRSVHGDILLAFNYDTWDPLHLRIINPETNVSIFEMEFYESRLIDEVQQMISAALKKEDIGV